jgi:hypothetical protein
VYGFAYPLVSMKHILSHCNNVRMVQFSVLPHVHINHGSNDDDDDESGDT